MISVSNDWIQAQSDIVRPEAFIEISGGGITLTKKNLTSFSYTQSGAIDNSQIPLKEIYFEILKTPYFDYDLPTDVIYTLKFGFEINNAVEMINVGLFKIASKDIKENGQTAKYTLNDQFTKRDTGDYFWLNDVYKGGSYQSVYFIDSTQIAPFYSGTLFEYVGGLTSETGVNIGGFLTKCSYGEVMQQLALVSGYTLVPRPLATEYRFAQVNVLDRTLTDYLITKSIQYKKPETEHNNQIKSYRVFGNKPMLFNAGYVPQYTVLEVEVNANGDTYVELDSNVVYTSAELVSGQTLYGIWRVLITANRLLISSTHNQGQTAKVKLYNYLTYDKPSQLFDVNNDGDIIDINSQLLYDTRPNPAPINNNVITCGNFLKVCGLYRDIVSVPCRIDPRVELFDKITIELPNSNLVKGIVEYVKITYNGAFNGEISIRKTEEQNGDYFCITKVGGSGNSIKIQADDPNLQLNSNFKYSYDRISWQSLTEGTYIQFNYRNKIYFKGNNSTMNKNNSTYYHFVGNNIDYSVSGNITSLYDETMTSTTIPETYFLCSLFKNEKRLVDASNLKLPATNLATGSYSSMFNGCSNLVYAPQTLPASSITGSSYHSMFKGCSSLITTPQILATSCDSAACAYMFEGCSSLTQAPQLRATTVGSSSYSYMFKDCSSLVSAFSNLPATTLGTFSYYKMFLNCTSLIQTPRISGIRLGAYCCASMFEGCTSLTKLPALRATTLQERCYNRMFYGCSNIKLRTTSSSTYNKIYQIPYGQTGTDATDATTDMFTSTGGTFTGTPSINTNYYTSKEVV